MVDILDTLDPIALLNPTLVVDILERFDPEV
jgi:hypothetical protein